MLRYAGAVADGVLLNHLTPAYAPRLVAEVRAGAAAAGRDPAAVEVICSVPTYVAPDAEGARRLDLLVITHSDLDHQGGARALARESPRLLVTCGALDRELVSDPEALVSQRYSAYLEHGIGYGEDALAWIRAMSVPTTFAGATAASTVAVSVPR